MCLLEHLYHKGCTTTRQSWLFSFYIIINNKQDEMKLENIWNRLQSSFVLLQFFRLSVLHYTTQLYSNLVTHMESTTYLCLVLVVLGSPKVSRVRLASLHTASLSVSVCILMHSLASIPLLLILEDKGGPTHGH